MEVALNQSGSNKMPNNLIAEPRFFLMVPYNFCIERNAKMAKYLEKMQKQKVKEFEEAKAKAQAEFNEQDSDEEKVPLQTVEWLDECDGVFPFFSLDPHPALSLKGRGVF